MDILNTSFENGYVLVDGRTKLCLGQTLEEVCADGTIIISDGKTLDSITNDKNSFGEVYCALNNSFVVVLDKGASGTLRDCTFRNIYCGDYHLGEHNCSEKSRIVFPHGLYYGMQYKDVLAVLGNPVENYSSEEYLQLRYNDLGVTIFIDYDTVIVEQIAWFSL